ncbi:nucleotide-binding universal stress UspA family protein [Gelidibacter sediminis]|uniref:Nucleotide-binding universal stress UspA family protein n=1 Tax=Gelidibacter sediminis TaxID=1608710 RepID=A0A4R7PJ94_9FLAO|nr:universal stress protein [Gelidibacter sediminis]TDU34473.1 nucleotide-binding universal stress UspA family protein [Gelidibacter sediminis]
MDKRILLLTDFSRTALNAARYALDLYKDRQCTFYFLNTYHEDSYSIEGYSYLHSGQRSFDVQKPHTEEQFKKLVQILRLHDPNPIHEYYTIAANNTLVRGVNDVISKNDIDIVIMGAKGVTSSRTVIFGMNTIDVMENITACPVLAIPEDVRLLAPKEIVFPTDFRIPFKRRELKYLINITQLHHSTIRVLYVKETAQLNKEQLQHKALLTALFKDIEHSFHEVESASVHEGINAFIDSRDSDIVAFIHQKKTFFSRLLSKPLVQELGYQSRVPVLVLKHRV